MHLCLYAQVSIQAFNIIQTETSGISAVVAGLMCVPIADISVRYLLTGVDVL